MREMPVFSIKCSFSPILVIILPRYQAANIAYIKKKVKNNKNQE